MLALATRWQFITQLCIIFSFFVASSGQFSVRKWEYVPPIKMNVISIKGIRKNKFEPYCVQLQKYCCNIDNSSTLWHGQGMHVHNTIIRVMPYLATIVFLPIYWSSSILLKNFLHTIGLYIYPITSLTSYEHDSFWNRQSVISSFLN